MTLPFEMGVCRGRKVRKKSLKSKRFPSRVSEPPFRRNWGSEVSPRGLLNSKLAVPGMEKGGKKKYEKRVRKKSRKKSAPAARAHFFWTKTPKCGDPGEDSRRGEKAWFKLWGLLLRGLARRNLPYGKGGGPKVRILQFRVRARSIFCN